MNIFFVIANAVHYFANFLELLIVVRILFSWIPSMRGLVIYRYVFLLTEPVLGPIRSLINKSPLGGAGMMIDFSPVIAGFFIEFCRNVIVSGILQFAVGK